MQVAQEAIKLFNIQGAIDSIAPLGFGHINDSFSVKVGGHGYLLQRLNTKVFKEPEIIENNLSKLLNHSTELFPEHLRGASGKYHEGETGNLWRVQEFVQDSYSPTKLTENELSEIAKGYGKFTAAFQSAEPAQYAEGIPDFHNLHHRLNQFEQALSSNSAGRGEAASNEIRAIEEYSWITVQFDELVQQGLPLRVCHNDAKAGNCLLSKKTGKFLKVVDLDTVWAGYALFDLGDMLRSMLFNIPENDAQLEGLEFDQKRFEVILDSFLAECGHSLEEIEVKSLPFGGLYMTYMMATRFLTDYLNGDVYYKTSHSEENLVRTRNQLKILDLTRSFLSLHS